MKTNLQDGIYAAHLDQSAVKLDARGNPLLVFQWKLDRDGSPLRSFVCLSRTDGTRNERGIALVQKWAPDWDGADIYWFTEHLEAARRYAVKLTVKNEPSRKDPTQTYPNVRWVNPAGGRFANPAKAPPPPAEEVTPVATDRATFRRHLANVQPTMHDVWRAFRLLYATYETNALEGNWFALIDRVRPEGRDVDQFEAADWQRALDFLAVL